MFDYLSSLGTKFKQGNMMYLLSLAHVWDSINSPPSITYMKCDSSIG